MTHATNTIKMQEVKTKAMIRVQYQGVNVKRMAKALGLDLRTKSAWMKIFNLLGGSPVIQIAWI